jgi:hypothetical protein
MIRHFVESRGNYNCGNGIESLALEPVGLGMHRMAVMDRHIDVMVAVPSIVGQEKLSEASY